MYVTKYRNHFSNTTQSTLVTYQIPTYCNAPRTLTFTPCKGCIKLHSVHSLCVCLARVSQTSRTPTITLVHLKYDTSLRGDHTTGQPAGNAALTLWSENGLYTACNAQQIPHPSHQDLLDRSRRCLANSAQRCSHNQHKAITIIKGNLIGDF